MRKAKRISIALIALILAFSFTFSMSSVSASAAKITKDAKPVKNKLPAVTEKVNKFAKAYVYKVKGKTSYGYDWSYNLYSKNIKVTCKYDFKKHEYRFKVTGNKYGLSKLELKYKTNDKKWVVVPMKVFVDPKNNIMRTKIKLS